MFFTILLLFGISAGCILAGKILIHYFQLESYQFPGYFRTVRRNLFKAILPGFCLTILLCVSLLIIDHVTSNAGNWLFCIIECFIMMIGGFLIGKSCSEKKAKKALVYTPRVKRLYGVSLIVITALLLLIVLLFRSGDWIQTPAKAFLIVFPFFLPVWIALCGLLAWPLEKAISEMYFRDAQRILSRRKDLIRIGITGSWGKTSVKFILGTILEEKYRTLVTPASFNTPMGVTKVIRNMLEPGHRVFIAEMGARHVGDIKEMCRLVHPQVGIITSVGPQHLDTFKTVERVARTKYELIEALPADGEAFFADDSGICRELYQKTKIKKSITGIFPGKTDLWAEDIHYSPEGTDFQLCSAGFRRACSTKLLGELNISNILLAASVALSLGLSLEQVVRGIEKIKPVEHRLQLISHPGGVNVIDDAFNSNIRGAKQAFQVLSQFTGKRIIVTPGMVELGEQEYELNREFGSLMHGCCDHVILVGKKRSESILQGLREKGISDESVSIVSSLEEATDLLKTISGPGDTILFENDLPDNYTEN